MLCQLDQVAGIEERIILELRKEVLNVALLNGKMIMPLLKMLETWL